MKTDKRYAFWRHDQFPFFLGGEIITEADDGKVETVEYGRGNWFSPVFTVNELHGKRMLTNIRNLQLRYKQRQKALHRSMMSDLYHSESELWNRLPDEIRSNV